MKWRFLWTGITAGAVLSGCGKNPVKPDGTTTKPVETVAEPEGPTVAQLAAALKSSRPDRLQKAIDLAMQLEAQEDDPIPTLIAALSDPTSAGLGETSTEKPSSSREAAVLALMKIGPHGKKALLKDGLQPLRAGMADAKPAVREHAANAVMMIGKDSTPLTEDVAALAGDKEMAVRSAAYRALEKTKAPATTKVLQLLLSDDASIASDAAASLSVNKVAGANAAPMLVAALKRKAPEGFSADQLTYVKNRAAEALAGLGKNAESAIPELVEILKSATVADIERMIRPMGPNDRFPPVPGHVLALRRIGKPAIPALMPLLKSDQPIVRYQTALTLGGIAGGVEVKELLPVIQTALDAEQGLPSGQMYVFEELMRAAIRLGAEPEPLAAKLLDLLSNDSDGVRFRAVNLFRALGRRALPALPKLQERLTDPAPLIQIAVLEVIRGMGPGAKDAAAEVAKLVESKDEKVSRAAVQTLRVIGVSQPKAVPTLVKQLESNDRNVVIEATQALGAIGPAAGEAVDPLVKLLTAANSHPDERRAALAALTAIGAPAKSAIPAVTKVASDKDAQLRAGAIACLAMIAPYDAALGKLFAERLNDSIGSVRVATLKSLASIGSKASASVPDIKKMMDGTKAPDLRIWCAATLAVIGSDVPANVAIVLDHVKSKTPAPLRLVGMEALALLGPKAEPAVPDLLEALKDKTPAARNAMSLRERAVIVCGQLAPVTKAAITPIADLLRDNDRQLRLSAAEALGAFGQEAVIAVPKLREAAESDDRELCEIAERALGKITQKKDAGEMNKP